jgi:Asp-tRNA(Asn)/Glu-tRNA(Gln) amidotransferase A subunit family amidase
MEKELGDTQRPYLAMQSDLMSNSTRQLVQRGLGRPEEVYVQAQTAATACRALLPAIFSNLDALLTPAVRGEAPASLAYTGDPVFCRAWTLLHTPTISLPLLRGPNGLPVGVQLVGRIGDDEALLDLASALMPPN